jgi:hypothetical protein
LINAELPSQIPDKRLFLNAMKTLIIPDLHHHVENAERWIASKSADRVVFLGDYVDDFGDNVSDARKTAEWLRRRIETTQDVFLLGNHDAPYLFPENPQLYCPGFTKPKAAGIREILTPEHWKRFQLAVIEQGWLLSHAGFHPEWIGPFPLSTLTNSCAAALQRAARGEPDPLFGAGRDRDGFQSVGGPLWMDWASLVPIPGINQIVGHTPGTKVREKITADSKNYCLDVRNGSAAAILSDGEVCILE